MEIRIEVLCLYRYFGFAAHMRDLFRKSVTKESLAAMPRDMTAFTLFMWSPPGMYLLYSYSGIYVVVEAWKELKLVDAKIDKLLESPFVEKLRRFRNATFHFQPEPLSLKHLEFFGTDEERTEEWLNELYRELERYFGENTLPMPKEMKELLRDKPHSEVARIIQDYWSSKSQTDSDKTEESTAVDPGGG